MNQCGINIARSANDPGTSTSFPIAAVRKQFPGLHRTSPRREVFFDAPAGTQICRSAIDRIASYLETTVANVGGSFPASRQTAQLVDDARSAASDILGGHPREIAFGPNTTSLTFSVSRALARKWSASDELVVSRLDHDANVAPWLAVADELGMTVRWLDFDLDTGRLRLDDLRSLLGSRTRLVAMTAASNALGSVTPLAEAIAIVRQHSRALTYIDGVQFVPHLVADVEAIGCDFFVCSAYKFFGPHLGILRVSPEALAELNPYKVRPAPDAGAACLETGAQSFEALSGLIGTVEYLEWLGNMVEADLPDRRSRIVAATSASDGYEQILSARLLDGLVRIDGLKLWGPNTTAGRVPTFSFTLARRSPRSIADALALDGINVWFGDFYAVEAIKRLGLEAQGGLIRAGLCHYSDAGEIDRFLAALNACVARG